MPIIATALVQATDEEILASLEQEREYLLQEESTARARRREVERQADQYRQRIRDREAGVLGFCPCPAGQDGGTACKFCGKEWGF